MDDWFQEYFVKLSKLEVAAYHFDPKNRDHIVHSLNVFLLGIYLVKSCPPLLSECWKQIIGPFSLWGFASTAHDIGYPVETHSRHLTTYLKPGFPDINIGIRLIIDQLANTDQINDSSKSKEKKNGGNVHNYFQVLDNYFEANNIDLGKNIQGVFEQIGENQGIIDHGILLSIVLCKYFERILVPIMIKVMSSDLFYEYLPENENEESFTVGFRDQFFSVITAICLHNLQFEKPLTMKSHPLAYLLVLCDELQEWNRFSFGKSILDANQVDIYFDEYQNKLIVKYALSREECKIKEKNMKRKLDFSIFNLEIKSYMES